MTIHNMLNIYPPGNMLIKEMGKGRPQQLQIRVMRKGKRVVGKIRKKEELHKAGTVITKIQELPVAHHFDGPRPIQEQKRRVEQQESGQH